MGDLGNTVEVSSVVSSIQEAHHQQVTTTSGVATANSTLPKRRNKSNDQTSSSFITANSSQKTSVRTFNQSEPLDRQLTDAITQIESVTNDLQAITMHHQQ